MNDLFWYKFLSHPGGQQTGRGCWGRPPHSDEAENAEMASTSMNHRWGLDETCVEIHFVKDEARHNYKDGEDNRREALAWAIGEVKMRLALISIVLMAGWMSNNISTKMIEMTKITKMMKMTNRRRSCRWQCRRWIWTSLKRSWRWWRWRSQGRRLAQGCEDWADRAEEQVYQEGEKHLVHFGPFDQPGQHHHHHIHQYYHHQRCFTAQVVKEDMFKYSTTKLGKAMEKVQLLSINTWKCADWFWNLKIVVWNLNARCWSRTLCWTSRSTTSQTWRTVPTIRWAFYCLPLLRGLIDDMFFLRQRQICLTMIFLLLRPRGSKLSLVSKTFQDVAAL